MVPHTPIVVATGTIGPIPTGSVASVAAVAAVASLRPGQRLHHGLERPLGRDELDTRRLLASAPTADDREDADAFELELRLDLEGSHLRLGIGRTELAVNKPRDGGEERDEA